MERSVSKDWIGGHVNYKLLVDTAILAGEIMMSSGAETYRVEDTMEHILRTSKCESIEAFALMTGIVTTINGEGLEQPITVVKTINERSTNLSNIIKVNSISRRYCSGQITLEEAHEQLKCTREKQYSRVLFNVATAGIAVGFAMMLGGNLIDVGTAMLAGFLLAGIVTFCKVIKMNGIMTDVLSCMGMAMLSMAIKLFVCPILNLDIVIVSAIMPVVPGVAITNAIRDTLQGDYLSGCARILEAFLKAASIAIGIGIGMAVFEIWIGGNVIW